MANKPFAIQGADLTLGGLNLQAGSNGVVIPGVTRATTYSVEEVNNTDGEQTIVFTEPPIIIDVVIFNDYANNGSSALRAEYLAELDDDGYIDEIEVNYGGVYLQQDFNDIMGASPIYAYTGTEAEPFNPFVQEDWTSIPFRPKMRAGEVENIGGGNADTGNFSFDQDTITNGNGLTLQTDRGTLAIGTNMETPGMAGHFHIGFDGSNSNPPSSDLFLGDDYNYVKLPGSQLDPDNQYGVEIGAHDRDSGSNHAWRFGTDGGITFPDNTVQTTAYTGQSGGSNADPRVWVQTFVSDTPLTDFPQIATSVEYDADGNVIGLFSHFDDSNGATYFSVGKYTATGTRIWTAKLGDDIQTDGWGLAVDSVDGWIYVAGQSDGIANATYPYDQATLTKIDPVNGSVEWHRVYDFGYSSASAVVDVDSAGNPVMVGYVDVGGNSSESYLAVTKIDKTDGSVTWSRKLDGQADEEALGMAVGPDDEVVAVGYMSQLAYGANNATVTVVPAPDSNVDWVTAQTYTLASVDLNITFNAGVPTITVVEDFVGGRTIGDTLGTILGSALGGEDGIDDMIVNVATISAVGDQDDRIVVVKYLSDGTIDWQKAIQFDSGFDCNGADADIDSQGNVYICGQYDIDGGNTGISLIKFNSSGVKQWSRRVVGTCFSTATSIVVGPDDKLYISGVNGDPGASKFIWVVAKYSLDGLVEWQRFVENTTSWTFSGQFFNGMGGGSNLAVRQDYVALAGGFGNPDEQALATLVQVPASGDVFTVGNWDFRAANLSGVLNSSASDIVVIDAGLTDSDNAGIIEGPYLGISTDVSNFLIGTLYSAPGTGNDTTLPYLELTNNPFIIQTADLFGAVTVSTTGTGSGAQFTVVIGEGPAITSVTATTPGTGYSVGQRYRIGSGQIGGSVDARDSIEFEVETVSSGGILTVINEAFVGAATNTPATYSGTSIQLRASPGDVIDSGVTLVRSYQGALFNIEAETEYDQNNYTSPLGTEWNNDGWGNLLNLQSRSYGTLRSALNNNVGNYIVGAELVMHDTINDKYYKFSFSDWGQNANTGSYAYTRTQVEDPNYFKKTNYGEEVDIIIPDDGEGAGVGITRGNNNGIYNPYREGEWDEDFSPGGTVWNIDGWDDLTNVETRTYDNFYAAYGNGGLGNKVPGSRAVMYVEDNNTYYAVEWTGWTQNAQGGGFSYLRYELNLNQLQQGITFSDGTTLKSAEGIGRVKLTAPGNRKIEEVHGYKSVSVTERTTGNTITTTTQASNSGNTWQVNINAEGTAFSNLIALTNLDGVYTVQVSADQTSWIDGYVGGNNGSTTVQIVFNNGAALAFAQETTVYYRIVTGGDPVTWWNSADLPGGSGNFRGAVIDYHAYTGDATIIGTIHIVDDDGDENITHTEVSSGSTDSENDELWLVQNEGTISYRRIDGESATLKIQWTAKVFYGSEIYD